MADIIERLERSFVEAILAADPNTLEGQKIIWSCDLYLADLENPQLRARLLAREQEHSDGH